MPSGHQPVRIQTAAGEVIPAKAPFDSAQMDFPSRGIVKSADHPFFDQAADGIQR
jgi:hypothetical protein